MLDHYASPMPLQITRPPLTDDELWHWVRAVWGVTIPRTAVCEGHVSPFQAFADAFFARAPVSIWKASRGFGGKSYLLGCLALTEAVALGAQVTVLGGSAQQSQNVHEHTNTFWYSPMAPNDMLESDPTQYRTRLTNGAWIWALMASQKSARGPHPQRLRLDEIDEMDLAILEAAQGQPMDARGLQAQTVMSSTHQYPDKTMSIMLERAGQKGWPVYHWSIGEGALVLTRRGEVPIQHVRSSDSVLTRQGWKSVQHVSNHGTKQVLVFELSNGRCIRATPEHEFATEGGWLRADQLQVGSPLFGVDLPSTRAAVPSAIVGGHVRVLGGVLMPPRAMGALHLSDDVGGSEHVGAMGDGIQVFGVDTGSVPTQVVELEPFGDVSSPQPPSQAVSTLLLPRVGGLADVPVTVGAGESPVPASRGSDVDPIEDVLAGHGDGSASPVRPVRTGLAEGAIPPRLDPTLGAVHVASIRTGVDMPVWDIGVHGAHEFVAEGVVVHNCFRETSNEVDGWLKPAQVERKRSEISDRMFAIEYDLQEPSFGGRAIETEFVERMFTRERGEWMGDPSEDIVIEEPEPTASYVTGVDWAKELDWTVVRTFRSDCHPWREVAFLRVNRKPWPVMVRMVEDRLRRYPGILAHDATGLGDVIDDLIDWPRRKVEPLVLKGRDREAAWTEYIAGIEQGAILSARIEYPYSEHKYVTHKDLYSTGGHPPDSFVAGAVAWLQRTRRNHPAVKPVSIMRQNGRSPWALDSVSPTRVW